MSGEFMTVKEICDQLHVSRWTVLRAIRNNQLKDATKVSGGRGGFGGTWRIPEQSFRKWIHQGTTDEQPDAEGADQ
jgi:excisionase family DNA binding protein